MGTSFVYSIRITKHIDRIWNFRSISKGSYLQNEILVQNSTGLLQEFIQILEFWNPNIVFVLHVVSCYNLLLVVSRVKSYGLIFLGQRVLVLWSNHFGTEEVSNK